MTPEINLKTPEIRANPYPTYARLRKESPVVLVKHPLFGKSYYLTRYNDIVSSFTDSRLANDRRNIEGDKDPLDRWWVPSLLRAFKNNMLATDAPDHRRLRDLVHKAFTPRRVEEMKQAVEKIVGELLDAAQKKQTVDLLADFALPLPLTVISEMMGVPEEDRLTFHRQMGGFLDNLSSPLGFLLQTPNAFNMLRFFRKLIRLRQTDPRDDLLTALVLAEEQGDRLNEDELVSMIFLLLLAGHETTVNLIGNGTLALLQHPEQLQKLRENPELIGSAVEELLRYGNPVDQPSPRFAREDIHLEGHVIPRGSTVMLLLASANRDESVFENPDTLDITRKPNRHVAFGMGVHYCLGAPLARLEGTIALQHLVRRFPQMKLAVPEQQLRWRGSIGLRGLKALPLRLS
ncbi:cytochrome P450 family protein [Archangium lansingense]|uniref:cytochrome P450 family protein n=1 Tax=Archangium lansingense TaxID=2995310 RepID=UPI003B7BF784